MSKRAQTAQHSSHATRRQPQPLAGRGRWQLRKLRRQRRAAAPPDGGAVGGLGWGAATGGSGPLAPGVRPPDCEGDASSWWPGCCGCSWLSLRRLSSFASLPQPLLLLPRRSLQKGFPPAPLASLPCPAEHLPARRQVERQRGNRLQTGGWEAQAAAGNGGWALATCAAAPSHPRQLTFGVRPTAGPPRLSRLPLASTAGPAPRVHHGATHPAACYQT